MTNDDSRWASRRSMFLWLGVALAAAACVGIGLPSVGSAGQEHRIWRERSADRAPVIERDTRPLPSLAGLVHEVKPAVVNIYTTQVIKPRKRSRQVPRFHDPFFERFFGGRNPFGELPGLPRGGLKRNALGSGFIISPDGYVLTNHHVVAEADEIKVKLADESEYEAKVVGSDEKTDVALLKIEPEGELPFAYLGDSERLEVGDWVVAIGNPFGLGHTVTAGILSGKGRVIGHGPYDDFLQTDASINVGNSGGPLFDAAGNVVGINTAIVPGGSGIGFAVPVNLAKELLPQLHTKGKVTRGWLGVGIQDLTEDLAGKFGVAKDKGVLVAQVFAGGPADKAGLEAGDIILSINGVPMKDMRELTAKVATLPPGSKATVDVLRDARPRSFEVELGERERGEARARGEPAGEQAQTSALGVSVVPLTSERARRLGLDENLRGVLVDEVDAGSPAAGVVRAGDVILEVNRRRVRTPRAFHGALAKTGENDSVLLRLQRGQSQVYVVIQR